MIWSIILVVWAGALAAGQETDALTAAEVERRIEALKSAPELDAARRDAARDVYGQALGLLGDAEALKKQADDHEVTAKDAPRQLQVIQEALAKPPAAVALTPKESLAEMEAALDAARADEASRRQALESLRGEPARRETRKADLARLIADERRRLEEVDRSLKQPAPPEEAPEMTLARRTRLEAARMVGRQQVRALEGELASLNARDALLQARIKLAEREHDLAERTTRAWKTAVEDRSQSDAREAERRAEAARRAAEDAHEVIRDLAARNAELARQTTEVTTLATEVSQRQESVSNRLRETRDKEAEARKRIAAVGLTDAIGILLRQHRSRLPDPRTFRARTSARKEEIGRIQLARIGLEDELASSSDLDAAVERLIAESATPVLPTQLVGVRSRLRRLLEDRKGQIESFLRDSDRYVASMVALDTVEQELIGASRDYAAYIDERVLWIRSAQPIWKASWSRLPESLSWLVKPSHWAGAGRALVASLRGSPGGAVLTVLLLAFLFVARRRYVRHVFMPETQAAKATSFVPTLQTLVASFFRALPMPALIWCIGWGVGRGADGDAFSKGLGDALQASAELLLTLSGLRQLFLRGGLGEAHFGWRPALGQIIRRNITWFAAVSIPAKFLSTFYERCSHDAWHVVTGRSALIVLLLALSIALGRVLRPESGVLAPTLRGARSGWAVRCRHICFFVAVGVPVALAILAALGYQYTAVELLFRLEGTLGLIFALVVIAALVSRALLVARRRIERRQAEAAGTAPSHSVPIQTQLPDQPPASPSASTPPPGAGGGLDAATMDMQSRQLLKSGILLAGIIGAWLIWVDVLPALGILRQVELWTTQTEATEMVVGSDGKSTAQTIVTRTAITLADVLFALLVLALTVLATKNIPGLLEVGILQRLPLHASSRYAFTMVARQIIVVVGLVVAFSAIGVSWNKVQWLVAAMGVGLGFGLQEIFGNFISGLILLFERRIRVDDVVTVGDVSGTVTRVRVLATTIRNWERKEFVVPNKDLITGRVMNWTLSDAVNRILIEVGVAYGSDTSKARDVLLSVAQAHPEVLSDPPPMATFEAFGDSSLKLYLRCFLPDLTRRLIVMTELHDRIDAAFKEAGLEIAFPQRDIHIRSEVSVPRPPKERSEEA